jgi:hypothetical protein
MAFLRAWIAAEIWLIRFGSTVIEGAARVKQVGNEKKRIFQLASGSA